MMIFKCYHKFKLLLIVSTSFKRYEVSYATRKLTVIEHSSEDLLFLKSGEYP